MKLKDRVRFEVSSYELTSHWETPFGIVYLYTFKDALDNVFIWKTPRLIEEDVYSVSGRIKSVEWYNNIKEFVLTYCKVNA